MENEDMDARTESGARTYKFSLLLTEWVRDEEGWVVAVVGLPGCATMGDDEKDAEKNILEAYKGYVDSCLDSGEAVPWAEKPELMRDVIEEWKGSELRWVTVAE